MGEALRDVLQCFTWRFRETARPQRCRWRCTRDAQFSLEKPMSEAEIVTTGWGTPMPHIPTGL
jgi:hypothetical protein